MRRIGPCMVGIAAALLLGGGVALAADQTILGRGMVVSDPLPGVNPSRRYIKVTAAERLSANTVVGDPLASGATVQVIVNGGTSTSQTFTLPAGAPTVSTGPGWVAKVSGDFAVYKYRDKNGEASPVTAAYVATRGPGSTFKLKVVVDARGNNGPVDVVPGNPTTDLGAILTLGGGDSYCVLFGGAAGGLVADIGAELVKAGRPTGEGCPTPAP
jgi:hypothetical protein